MGELSNDRIIRTVSHPVGWLNRLDLSFKNQEQSDVRLIINNNTHYYCHRIVLCHASDVFSAMMRYSRWSEYSQDDIFLTEDESSMSTFHDFLKYLYFGQFYFTVDNVLPALMLADKYMIKNLKDECFVTMTKLMALAVEHDMFMTWQRNVQLCGPPHLQKIFCDFLIWNASFILSHESSAIDLDMLCSILREDDLVVKNEFSLFKLAVNWLNRLQTKSESELMQITMQVISLIRFPMLTKNQLLKLSLISPHKISASFAFIERMRLGSAFHLGMKTILDEYLENPTNRQQVVPRIYTEEKSAILVTVDNVSKLQPSHATKVVFNSPGHETDTEWSVNIYPKGVRFEECCMIRYVETIVPAYTKETIRVTILCHRQPSDFHMKCKISVLVYGMQGEIECVCAVKQVTHTFTELDRILHIDDIIPYGELNGPEGVKLTSQFLTDANRDALKLHIVIQPVFS